MKLKKLIVLAAIIAMGAVAVSVYRNNFGHSPDDGYGTIEPNDIPSDEHDEEQVIELTEEQIAEIGIKLAAAAGGKLDVYVSLAGETTVNANRMAHIVPGISGRVREVGGDIGDAVAAGQTIAWLESTKLGGAKVQYLTRLSEVSCCSIELVRAQEINDNTLKLLEMLKTSPSLEALRSFDGSAMGMNRSLLVSSYAEFTFARETYLREKDLYEKKISSKEDFLKSESAFKKADALYVATQDSVNFDVNRNLLEARRAQNIREIELKAAERLLYVLGLGAKDVNDLKVLSRNQTAQTEEEDECSDPNCAECALQAAAKERDTGFSDIRMTNEKLAWYPIRAAFNGTIISRHITLGEVVSDSAVIFVVADLSSVWVDLHVYQKDLAKIRKAQRVVISAGETIPEIEGEISYVGPVFGAESRTVLARVVLPNPSGMYRPGLFVTARVAVDAVEADVIVPRAAIQTLDGKKCVFIRDDHGFEPRFITSGQSNSTGVQITSGLKPGEQYVTEGAFALKAKMVTSTLDSHAGHGH